jgi:hypothetical protein
VRGDAAGWKDLVVGILDLALSYRIAVYNAILEPFIILFSSNEAGRADPSAVLAPLVRHIHNAGTSLMHPKR